MEGSPSAFYSPRLYSWSSPALCTILQVEEATPRCPYWSDQYSEDWGLTIWGWLTIVSTWALQFYFMVVTLRLLEAFKQ